MEIFRIALTILLMVQLTRSAVLRQKRQNAQNLRDLPQNVIDGLSSAGTNYLKNLYAAEYTTLKEQKDVVLAEEKECSEKAQQLKEELEQRNTAKLEKECIPCIKEKCTAFSMDCALDKLPVTEPTCAELDAATELTNDDEKNARLGFLCGFYRFDCRPGEEFSEACTQDVVTSCKARLRECATAKLPTSRPSCSQVEGLSKLSEEERKTKVGELCMYYIRECDPNREEFASEECIAQVKSKCEARIKECVPDPSGFCGTPVVGISCVLVEKGIDELTDKVLEPTGEFFENAAEEVADFFTDDFANFFAKDLVRFFEKDVVQFFDQTVGDFITEDVGQFFTEDVAGVLGDIGDFFADDVADFFTEDIKNAFEDIGDKVGGAFVDFGEFFTDGRILDFLDNKVLGELEDFGKDTLSGLIDFGEGIGDIFEDIGGGFEGAFGDVVDFGENVGSEIGGAFGDLGDALGDIGSDIGGAFEDLGKGLGSIFGKKRRRRQAAEPPTCAQIEDEDTRSDACLYFTNECPCQAETLQFDADEVCPTYAEEKEKYKELFNNNAALFAIKPENLIVEFTSAKVDVNNKLREKVYMGYFTFTVAGKPYSIEHEIGLSSDTLKETLPGILKTAVEVAI